MKKAFRKYHRVIGIIVCLPLLLTVLTGMLVTVVKEWPINTGISSKLNVENSYWGNFAFRSNLSNFKWLGIDWSVGNGYEYVWFV